MRCQSNIIRSLLKVIGFMAFILLIISNKRSFIFTEDEPLILLLFSLFLFSVATGIKLKLGRSS
ncbi:MAG TPA: hypothetical protein VFY40_18560 [Blastocatellia bacterium]|nr:hypothetical protein [Blastocatellia bacterium]